MRKVLLFLLLSTWPVAAFAQQTTQAQEMRKLDFLVGEWQGEGWTELVPSQRRTAAVTEKVQSKLNGTVLLIEGLGKTKATGKQEELVVHNALGLIFYDAGAKLYRLKSFLADGRSTDAEASFVEGAFQWRFQAPQTSIRYTVKLTEKGEWFEIGEMSPDGKSWRQFHEMTLRRIQ